LETEYVVLRLIRGLELAIQSGIMELQLGIVNLIGIATWYLEYEFWHVELGLKLDLTVEFGTWNLK